MTFNWRSAYDQAWEEAKPSLPKKVNETMAEQLFEKGWDAAIRFAQEEFKRLQETVNDALGKFEQNV